MDIWASNWTYGLEYHGQLVWGRITFQPAIYHSFPLKLGCIKIIPIPVTLSASIWDFASDIQQGNYSFFSFNFSGAKLTPF